MIVDSQGNGAAVQEEVREMPTALNIDPRARFSPNQLRHIRAATGLPLETVMGDEANIFQALIYLKLRGQGFDPSWEACGDVEVILEDQTEDPTSAVIATASPPSVTTGD